jgi:hypothetical protein
LGWRRQLEVEAKTGRVPAHFGIVMAQSFTATNDFIAYYYMRNVANFHLFVLKKKLVNSRTVFIFYTSLGVDD